LEQIYDERTGTAAFELFNPSTETIEKIDGDEGFLDPTRGERLVPLNDDIVRSGFLLLPSGSEPYGETSAVQIGLAEVSRRPFGFAGVPPNR